MDLQPDDNLEPRISVPHISFSQLSTYLRCSYQYYFAYILKLKQRPSLPLAIGSGGHNALEYAGKYRIKKGIDLAVPDLLDVASTLIDSESNNLEEDVATPKEKGVAKDNALSSIRVYQTLEAPKITPIAVELEFNLDMNDPTEENVEPIRIINGKIDLLDSKTGVWDHKFTSRAKSQSDVDLSPQLSLYGKVFKNLTGMYPTNTGFQMFIPPTKTRPNGFLKLGRTPELMKPAAQESRFNRLRFQFQRVERGIRLGQFIPTDDPRTCSWCGYRDRCQASLVDDFEAAQIRGET